MKTLIAFLIMLFSLSAFAQKAILVKGNVIDLGDLRGTNKFLLKVDANTPAEFKVKMNYKYRFVSQQIDNVFIGPSGDLGFSTRSVSSETYENKTKLMFDIGDSTAAKGDALDLLVEISRPNENTHNIKIVVSLVDAKGNMVSGGRKLMGLLGRAYKVEAICD